MNRPTDDKPDRYEHVVEACNRHDVHRGAGRIVLRMHREVFPDLHVEVLGAIADPSVR